MKLAHYDDFYYENLEIFSINQFKTFTRIFNTIHQQLREYLFDFVSFWVLCKPRLHVVCNNPNCVGEIGTPYDDFYYENLKISSINQFKTFTSYNFGYLLSYSSGVRQWIFSDPTGELGALTSEITSMDYPPSGVWTYYGLDLNQITFTGVKFTECIGKSLFDKSTDSKCSFFFLDSSGPTVNPTNIFTFDFPSIQPTYFKIPSVSPSLHPISSYPTSLPTTKLPTFTPHTTSPSSSPSTLPILYPTISPIICPTIFPTQEYKPNST